MGVGQAGRYTWIESALDMDCERFNEDYPSQEEWRVKST